MSFTIIVDPKVDAYSEKCGRETPSGSIRSGRNWLNLQKTRRLESPLKKPLRGFWRLHIGHYVLVYKVDRKNKKIILADYAHHDEVY